MPLHLKKLAPGIESVAELKARQKRHLRVAKTADGHKVLNYRTGIAPKRLEEIMDGGSLYWVIKGFIRARQLIWFIGPVQDSEGNTFCRIQLDPKIVPTEAVPHRPFQGWRYLKPEEAPPDIRLDTAQGLDDLPPRLLRELRELGLL